MWVIWQRTCKPKVKWPRVLHLLVEDRGSKFPHLLYPVLSCSPLHICILYIYQSYRNFFKCLSTCFKQKLYLEIWRCLHLIILYLSGVSSLSSRKVNSVGHVQVEPKYETNSYSTICCEFCVVINSGNADHIEKEKRQDNFVRHHKSLTCDGMGITYYHWFPGKMLPHFYGRKSYESWQFKESLQKITNWKHWEGENFTACCCCELVSTPLLIDVSNMKCMILEEGVFHLGGVDCLWFNEHFSG